MKSFDSWTLEDLELTFGLKKVENLNLMKEWLSSSKEITATDKHYIDGLRKLLKDRVSSWNPDELKMHFIGPFMYLINFITEKYSSFTQRTLTAKINDIEVSGKVDYMVATGKQKPRNPYFFLHEYKPSRRATNDPDGQLLIEMLSAQSYNHDNHPLFGIVVEGKYWNFIILQDRTYQMSDSFDATVDDVYQIYAIICKVKEYIEEIVN